MACLFCGVKYHKSQNCDKFKTEKARKEHPNSKRFCSSCFVETHLAHGKEKCEVNENCHAWYSAYHHKLFCKERIKVLPSNLFLPKIDQGLLTRFFKHLDMDEKYLMLVSSQSANVSFNHIKVMDSFDEKKIMKCLESDFVVIVNILKINGSNHAARKKLFDFIKAKTIVLPPKIVIMDSGLPADMVLQLISSRTKKFSMSSCPPNLSFSDIIKNAPNLEKIKICDFETNIIYDDNWIKDSIKYINGKNLKLLIVKLDKVDFNVEDMVQFIKEKCCKTVKINIWFAQALDEDDEDGEIIYNLERRLDEHYLNNDDDSGTLTIGYEGVDGYVTFPLGKIDEP